MMSNKTALFILGAMAPLVCLNVYLIIRIWLINCHSPVIPGLKQSEWKVEQKPVSKPYPGEL
jgi:hypothetical protein